MHNCVLTVAEVDTAIRKMKLGKAAGMDGVTAEHFIYSHPLVVVLVTLLLNALIKYSYVPLDFTSGIIVPLLKGNDSDSTCVHSYRGITLSCVLSKVFEMCLLVQFEPYLTSAELQFGFKSKIGCMDAILTARTVVNYFTDRCSTITMCTLDLSKAFDKVNHCVLFMKLMERNIPKAFIDIISY